MPVNLYVEDKNQYELNCLQILLLLFFFWRPRSGPGSREAARWQLEKLAEGRGQLSARPLGQRSRGSLPGAAEKAASGRRAGTRVGAPAASALVLLFFKYYYRHNT